MNSISNMMDDINKYAAIWDDAQAKGIFKDAPKPPTPSEPEETADFFGQYLTDDYDMDRPLNEVDTKYWAQVSRLADPNGYVDPLKVVSESKEDAKKVADKMATAHNPITPTSVGKDQDPEVTQNWAVGGKEYFQLEELKVRLEKLESKLNAMETEEKSSKSTQSKIDELKKQIDDLSDSLSGDRFSHDG